MDVNRDQEFFVQLPGRDGRSARQFGPYSCPEDTDIASEVLELSAATNPLIPNTHFRVKLPKNLSEYILTVTYPLSQYDGEAVVVYGVQCDPEERITEGEIKNRLKTTFEDRDVISDRCLCVYSEPPPHGEVNSSSNPRKLGQGTVLVAKYYDYNSDSYSPPSGGNRLYSPIPPTSLPLGHGVSEHHQGPLVATSGPHKSGTFVVANQNLILPSSPTNDGLRKILLTQTTDAPTQALVPDRPHLQQKPLLQNLEELAGCTALQSVLVTPSGEQNELGAPLPCQSKTPTIVITPTTQVEEREGERGEEIVQPQSESSSSVSSSSPDKPTTSGSGNLLEPYRRQRSLSDGEDMVAPVMPKSHKGMVTGRTLSLPPKEPLNEKQKSTENLCTGTSSNISRTQSDLSSFVQRKNCDSNLLLSCGATQNPSDSSQEPKVRRRSMPNLGIQRQNSGNGQNEAVITGVPEALLIQKNRSPLALPIHEGSTEEERELTNQNDRVDESQASSTSNPPPPPPRAIFRIGSQSASEESSLASEEAPSVEEGGSLSNARSLEAVDSHCQDQEQQEEREEEEGGAILEQEVVEGGDNGLSSEESHLNSVSLLPQREIKQQVHILEHVYNGRCVLGDDCPRPPSAENHRQMSRIIEDDRNGTLNPSLTELFKSYIRVHCNRCRDASCRVPHMAVGCPPPGTVDSSCSLTDSSPVTSQSPLQESSPPNLQPDPSQLRQQQIALSISFDLDGNVSTSDEVREFLNHQGPTQCAESRYQLEERGANDTDYPLLRPSSRRRSRDDGVPPTNGTPPDEAHPVVCAPTNFCPRPGMLPGLRASQGEAPIVATPNDADMRRRLSPLPSTGFQPLPMYGQPAHSRYSPIQQASDFDDVMVLNRQRACYIQPTRRSHNLFQGHFQFSPSELPDVCVDGFPYSGRYLNIEEGVLIYCSERLTNATGFSLGEKGHPPNKLKSAVLGRGGNGHVYGYYQNGQMFAVKGTPYRQTELQAWVQLDHPNVLPLLGVMWGGHGGHFCYQFMPKMTSDLSAVMRSVSDLCTLVSSETRIRWENVLRPNVCHVLRSVVCGVQYLHNKGIQHYDLKASNILINKLSTCPCGDIFSCVCPPEDKCEVKIADFDSVKMFTPGVSAASVSDLACEPKPSGVKVLGTPFYRAPEQFKQHKQGHHPQLFNSNGLEGPWCDMWAIGVIITQLCLGKPRTREREMVCQTMVSSPVKPADSPTPEVEGFVARERLSTLRSKCMNCSLLSPLAEIAADCLEPDFKKRVTADSLLENDFFL